MRWFHHVRNDKNRITSYHVNALKYPKMCCLMKTIQESLSSTQLLKFLSSTLKKNEKKISNKHRRSTITVYFAELHLLFLYSDVDACIYSNAWIIEEYILFILVLVISTRHIQLWSQALPQWPRFLQPHYQIPGNIRNAYIIYPVVYQPCYTWFGLGETTTGSQGCIALGANISLPQ